MRNLTYLTKRRLITFLLLILLFKLIIFAALSAMPKAVAPMYGIQFPDGYDKLALNLAEGNGYRFFPETALTLMREPGYPVFLSWIFRIFGPSLSAARFANILLSFVAAWLSVLIAKRISDDHVVLTAAPIIFLLHPATLIAESRGGVESLFVLLLTLFVLLQYRAIESNKWYNYALAGGGLGLTVLVKGAPLLFPLFLLPYLLMAQRGRERAWSTIRNVGVMVLAMFLIMSPWILRNYALVGEFIPTASVKGVAAFHGLYICKHHSFHNALQQVDRDAARQQTEMARDQGYKFKANYYRYFYSSKDEVEFHSGLWKKVANEYAESPLLFLECSARHLFGFWFAGKTWTVTGLNMIVQVPFLLLAIAGVYACYRGGKGRQLGPLLCFVIYFVAVYVPLHAQARYSVPLLPFLSIFAAIGGATILRHLYPSREHSVKSGGQ